MNLKELKQREKELITKDVIINYNENKDEIYVSIDNYFGGKKTFILGDISLDVETFRNIINQYVQTKDNNSTIKNILLCKLLKKFPEYSLYEMEELIQIFEDNERKTNDFIIKK